MFLLRRRRRAGISTPLLIFGGLGLVMACLTLFIGVPATFMRARTVRALPQYRAADLATLAPGEAGLFTARIPAEALTDADGFALAVLRQRIHDENPDVANLREGEDGPSRDWRVVEPLPVEFDLDLDDGTTVKLLLPNNTGLQNAETLEYADEDRLYEYEKKGYRAGQTLTIEGTWESNNTITASYLFNGSPSGYVEHTRNTIGGAFLASISCGLMAVLMAGAGVFLRLTGR